jgi:hypothetical protein
MMKKKKKGLKKGSAQGMRQEVTRRTDENWGGKVQCHCTGESARMGDTAREKEDGYPALNSYPIIPTAIFCYGINGYKYLTGKL